METEEQEGSGKKHPKETPAQKKDSIDELRKYPGNINRSQTRGDVGLLKQQGFQPSKAAGTPEGASLWDSRSNWAFVHNENGRSSVRKKRRTPANKKQTGKARQTKELQGETN